MRLRDWAFALTAAPLISLTACASPDGTGSGPASPGVGSATPGTSRNQNTPPPPPGSDVVGTVVRFSSPRGSVDVTIDQDNPTVRDLLRQLPLQLTLEELAGREKIATLPRKLDTADSPGSDPQDGHLIYFVPWGNLGFYYNAEGIGYSDDTIHIGTSTAGRAELDRLQGGDVRVAIAGG